MQLNYNETKALDQQYGSSFYLLDVEKLRGNYQKINQSFKNRYEKFIIGYSYKTNYLPYMCRELNRLGAYAEVVSRLEYDLAIKIGVDPKRIIFNGPLKSAEDIQIALKNNSILNIDSLYEIDYVKSYCMENPNQQVKVGLRVNFDISKGEKSALQAGFAVSRFGICAVNGNLEAAINSLKEMENLKIAGLHGHFSTSERRVESFVNITEGLCEFAKKYIYDSLEYIDIGGGLYGELPPSFHLNAPTFDDYAEAVCRVLNEEFEYDERKPYLILEPGISMVANVFHFIAKVMEVKQIQNQYFVLIDGSVHNVKPTMHQRNLPMKIIKQEKEQQSAAMYNIVGYTCMEKDYLASGLEGELPSRDDYIIFENVGAYTIVFNPPFIKERPGIVAFDHDEFFVVRKKESLEEFFNKNLYVF